jgi:FixJ family two-component response regulator
MVEVSIPGDAHVSIIDDDTSVREGLLDLLSSVGVSARSFQSAEDFLGSDEVPKTSCLIADVQLPGLSGLELYNHLILNWKRVPTILITAFPKENDRAGALRSGIACYLSKPFGETELLACIRSAVSSHRDEDPR